MVKREEVLIYLNYKHSLIEYFKEQGASVEYVNKRAGYCVVYIDKDKEESFLSSIKNLHGIKKFEVSPTELVELDI